MPSEPEVKRACIFIDGQNLYYAVKQAFGYEYPNYDPGKLADQICAQHNWIPVGVNFYTGVPDQLDNPRWNYFWTLKLAFMRSQGINTFSRKLKYRNQFVSLPSGEIASVRVGMEKGIDVRIALDIVRLARENRYDVAVLFSQDQDLSEAVNEVKAISKGQERWIKAACAFPVSSNYQNNRGIDRTEWLYFEKGFYDNCIDSNDYRPSENR